MRRDLAVDDALDVLHMGGARRITNRPTAGRQSFGDIAPALADDTDKVLFGEV